MRIIVDIGEDQDGRAVGTVQAEGQGDQRPFSGNLEFLAAIEDLYRTPAPPARPRDDAEARRSP